ncbi:uncharacterized protein FIBRA_03551 [Fibroporia radiculosa]|uniref:Uncharacterized protein n=1 Tax=Fibroporia radiculosa TaxID=599839 RepID=J4HW20_9APHY|nr:uncharacterized protein FIBRA_03551 [Fibroporia radiculosa]CCM01497.1 predicted protein [Fibroporia radiculosa]
MIILDDSDELLNSNKFLTDDARSVVRPCTPTPSLPSYESCQSLPISEQPCLEHDRRVQAQQDHQARQQQQDHQAHRGCWPKHTNARFKRGMLYALVVYFVLTVAVGVPVIVVKLRHRSYERQAMYSASSTTTSAPSLIADSDDAPLLESSAVSCNDWTKLADDLSMLQYSVPLDGLIFVYSNVSYQSNVTNPQNISGSLLVDVNSDPTIDDALVSVSMHYSNPSLIDRTNVCLLNISSSNGVYLYVPTDISEDETLSFNVTFLFPQAPSLHISQFTTRLPIFTQRFSDLSYIDFDMVTIAGPKSDVHVEAMNASSLTVTTALAEIEGSFNVSRSLVLETISAPIDANISLYNDGFINLPTFLDVSTGNAALNASVQLYLPPAALPAQKAPNFITNFRTFNAPLAVAATHLLDSSPATLMLHAESSVGKAFLSIDNKFSGTFDVSTTFETADVITSSIDTIGALAQYDLGVYEPVSLTTAVDTTSERRVDFDTIQSSKLAGWVGSGTRPSSYPSFSWKNGNGQGHLDLVSTLGPVALFLNP